MKIVSVESWLEAVPLTRPYTIATRTISAVDLFFVLIRPDDGLVGHGSASPAPQVTGETPAACADALDPDSLAWLRERDPRLLRAHCRELETRLGPTPAARAALDMALHDLAAQAAGVPLVDFLGRCHEALPTSITVGIKDRDEALAETDEYLGRGFRCLKVKVGVDLEAEVELLALLRERVGPTVRIRIDANQGYDLADTKQLLEAVERLDIELVEQPLEATVFDEARSLPEGHRRLLAADESLHGPTDAVRLSAVPAACGIFNIKLMKCGGVAGALTIGDVAAATGTDLMWGCNDESAVSIAAALHAAYACPRTRYLDLDGSLDLARDPATGGFRIEDGGLMRLLDRPGLGVEMAAQAQR